MANGPSEPASRHAKVRRSPVNTARGVGRRGWSVRVTRHAGAPLPGLLLARVMGLSPGHAPERTRSSRSTGSKSRQPTWSSRFSSQLDMDSTSRRRIRDRRPAASTRRRTAGRRRREVDRWGIPGGAVQDQEGGGRGEMTQGPVKATSRRARHACQPSRAAGKMTRPTSQHSGSKVPSPVNERRCLN